jgi:hypothetical protein
VLAGPQKGIPTFAGTNWLQHNLGLKALERLSVARGHWSHPVYPQLGMPVATNWLQHSLDRALFFAQLAELRHMPAFSWSGTSQRHAKP